MNELPATAPPGRCPKCDTPLPIQDAVVCPHCDVILRRDLDNAGTGSEVSQSGQIGLMIIGAVLIFAVMSAAFGMGAPISLILAGIYIIAFKSSARRTGHPVKLVALSLFIWLGYCAVIIAILFAGCLIVFRGGFGG